MFSYIKAFPFLRGLGMKDLERAWLLMMSVNFRENIALCRSNVWR